METINETSVVCVLCHKEIQSKELYQMTFNQSVVHESCLFSSHVLSIQIIYKIVQLINEKENPEKIIKCFKQLDRLELREEVNYELDNLQEAINTLKPMAKEHIQEISNLLFE